MIFKLWLLCLLGGGLLWGQARVATPRVFSSQASQPQAGGSRPSNPDEDDQAGAAQTVVPLDAPVLTIKGFCPGRSSDAGQAENRCETVVTREEFEKLATAVKPDMNRVVKQQLAGLYPRLLVMANEAEKQGLDKQPPFEELMAFARLQLLNQALTHKLQQDAGNISEQEISDYYRAHPETFEQYTLQRLYVPVRKQAPPATAHNKSAKPTTEEQAAREKASEEEMTRLAESLRARAAAGEDLLKLQKEAFDAAGVKVAAPNTSMGKVRRTALPASHTAIFALKAGEISAVVSDTNGHYVYKLEGKDELGLDQVREDIRSTLQSQRMKEAMDRIQNSFSTETNESYFGSTRPAERSRPPGAPGPH